MLTLTPRLTLAQFAWRAERASNDDLRTFANDAMARLIPKCRIAMYIAHAGDPAFIADLDAEDQRLAHALRTATITLNNNKERERGIACSAAIEAERIADREEAEKALAAQEDSDAPARPK